MYRLRKETNVLKEEGNSKSEETIAKQEEIMKLKSDIRRIELRKHELEADYSSAMKEVERLTNKVASTNIH